MLQNTLFQILSETHHDTEATFEVGINWQHPLFGGHFPEHPIMPGACMVQIAVDLFSRLKKYPFLLAETGNVKFLQVVTPEINDGITFRLSWKEGADDFCNVRVSVTKNDRIFSKMILKMKRM